MVVDYEYKSQQLMVSYISDGGWIKMKYYKWPIFVDIPEGPPRPKPPN